MLYTWFIILNKITDALVLFRFGINKEHMFVSCNDRVPEKLCEKLTQYKIT